MVDSSFTAFTVRDIYRRIPILRLVSWIYKPIPASITEQRIEHYRLSQEKVKARMARDNDRDDFFAHIISDKNNPPRPDFVLAQANTLVVAGSETTATALLGLTWYLLNNPDALKILQIEVRTSFSDSTSINAETASKLPYLFAVIEEGLRLYPPIGFGLPRVSPGAVVDNHYIPAGVSTYATTSQI